MPFSTPSMVSTEKEPAKFVGTIIVKVPNYPEKLRLQADFASLPKATDKSTDAEVSSIRRDQMLAVAALSERVMPMVKSCELKTADGKHSVSSVDELYSHPEFEMVCTELTLAALKGFTGN